ncbi:hypothetical protein CW676_07770 [Macrococcoides caseolyticum]|uniref:membrane lipoprotein lipid attachment site-containing protein n=1 Tax=Macrococcoides caseolyticum TaxID=69966 RepID=UPI000C3228A0|nr:membrane lipoprotein lipid attachment site-containing protein [Macrococcus caseolyticus]PKE06429.1 hypothetical protein CW692_08320 [Macrococcus caseolyticus]PKE23552.1 hypothetical protein CW689_08400 [Macrococcus caseolyticus]PKE52890.1 hypothetical protein CW676_07770 [Macrococcus caseolyticus]PKF37884.1 hypothetical protein CW681_09655 [Macrococcus caseolyticus]
MKKSIMFIGASLLLLSGCNNEGEGKQEKRIEKEKTSVEEKTIKELNTVEGDKVSEKSTEEVTKKDATETEGLTEEKKIALAFFADSEGKYSITKNEILTGVIDYQGMQGKEKKQLYKLLLIKSQPFSNAPEGMNFYTVHPPRGNFATVIGVSNDKIFVGGTQAVLDYNEIQSTGNEYETKVLYEKNKHLKSLDEVADKVEIVNENPLMDEQTRKDFEAHESAGIMAHARTQVYQAIDKFEGKPKDTDNYLWDNVEWEEDGWTVNYRDKNGEKVGTYTIQSGKIVKFDADGNKVK